MNIDLLPLRDAPAIAGLPGYPAPIVSDIVCGYLDRGAKVTAVTTSVGLSDIAVVRSGALTLAVVPRTRARSALRMFREERKLIKQVLKQDTPDVLHAHWTYEFAAAAQDAHIPALITAHDDSRVVVRFQPTLYRLLRLALNDRVLQGAAHVSTPSEYLASRIRPRTKGAVSVIPNFLGREVLLRKAPLAPREKTVITVSNGFSGWKNVASAVQAFAASEAVERGWHYELVGERFEVGGEAEQWARARGLDRGLHFRGLLKYAETLDAIEQAAVMIHPSLEESFGMSVLEAMALRTPVIGGAQSGNVPTLLSDGCGVLCDVASPQSISRALDGLISQSHECTRIATLARERVEADYSADRVVGLYWDALSAILSASSSKEGGA